VSISMSAGWAAYSQGMVDAELVRALRGAAVEVLGRAMGDDEMIVRGQRAQLIHTRRRKVKRVEARIRARLRVRGGRKGVRGH
jgi:hypothetical protein